jgi:Protein of unknown function (DUF1593)
MAEQATSHRQRAGEALGGAGMTPTIEARVSPGKPRTIVTADPELDDLNSLIRLLLHSNEMQIDGLIYASSKFHWKGNEAGDLFFLPGREYETPQKSFRWAPGERFIHDAVEAYEKVHSNLAVHDKGYPTPEYLRSVIRDGNIEFEGEMDADTPGSVLIEEALLDDDPQPLHLQVWAGTSTIARALRAIEHKHSGTPGWDDLRARVSRKAIITKFASQDETFDGYILKSWPDIRVTDVAQMTWGYFVRRVLPASETELLSADWTRDNVTSVGPLGALYRVWGDGRQMVPGDYTDYFHLSGLTKDELTALGYRVWSDLSPEGEWISEGDTTNLLNLVGNGLRGHEHPTFGGWGGRAIPTDEGPDTWTLKGSLDRAPDGTTPAEYNLTRWFRTAQYDFATRLRWTVTERYDEGHHHPAVSVSPGENVTAKPGEQVDLRAVVSHPDGRGVTIRWWQYQEAGTYPGAASLSDATSENATVTIPDDAQAGQTIHIILEVTDDADMPLTKYQRVIITVERNADHA